MPNCFQLIDKSSNEAVSLNLVDERICKEVLNVEVHPKRYGGGCDKGSFNWFDTVGFSIAMGKDLHSKELKDHYLNEIKLLNHKDKFYEEDLHFYESAVRVIDFLRKNYRSVAFYSVK